MKRKFSYLHGVSEARVVKSSEQELSSFSFTSEGRFLSLPTSEDPSIIFSATFELLQPILYNQKNRNLLI